MSTRQPGDGLSVIGRWLGPCVPGEAAEWRSELRLARSLKLACLAAHSIATRLGGNVPSEVRTALEDLEAWRKANLVRLAIAERLASDLGAEGVLCVPIKGIALISREYADPGCRPMDDIDLLVSPEEFGPALRRMTEWGWDQCSPNRRRGSGSYQVRFRRARAVVEVHRAFEAPELFPVDYGEVLQRASAPGGSTGLRLMDPVDTLLGLAVHQVKHGYSLQPRDLVDLVLVARRVDDWPAAWSRARTWGLERALSLSLRLASTIDPRGLEQRSRLVGDLVGAALTSPEPPFARLHGFPWLAHAAAVLGVAGPARFLSFSAGLVMDRSRWPRMGLERHATNRRGARTA